MRKRFFLVPFAMPGLLLSASLSATAWEHHPMFTGPVVSTMTEVAGGAPVAATPLKTFLTAVEADLVALLNDEESWARANMASYKPRPEALAFQATGTPDDICGRFFSAIRVNPSIKTALYVSPLAGAKSATKGLLAPADVSILQDTSNLAVFNFEELAAGDPATPMDVVTTASNEPDYGMDIGLFEDNSTAFGQQYGFGMQPFGNPNLDYGSQAPFHMGFYHESWIVYLFAPFLNETYPEYRIHLFKSLSEFAFSHGQDYWGWRFMGWGLHYMGDLSMPYHTAALPGYTTLQMLWVNILSMLGFPTPQANAVQLSSNRHVALETFQGIILNEALLKNDTQDPTLAALLQARPIPAYSDDTPRCLLSDAAHRMTTKMDKAIARYMPQYYVSNPSVELGDIPERNLIVDMIAAEHGPDAVTAMDKLQAEAFSAFATHGRSYVLAILGKAG